MNDWLRRKLGLGSYYEGWGFFALVWERLRFAAHNVAWPKFDCADCIGMIQYGCQCVYYEASAPGCGPERFHLIARWIYRKIWSDQNK